MFSMYFYVLKQSYLVSHHVTYNVYLNTQHEFTFICNPIIFPRMEVRFTGYGFTMVFEVFVDRDMVTVSVGFLYNK